MKRRVFLLVMVATSFGLANVSTVAQAQEHPAHGSPWQTAEGWVGVHNCAGELYYFTGQYMERVKIVEDGAGGFHVSTFILLRGTAVGVDSGSEWRAIEPGHFAEHHISDGPTIINGVGKSILRPLDQTSSAPDMHFRFLYHLTIDASGNVTSEVDKFELICP